MRYMTPDTPSARMLESHEKEKQTLEMETAKMATVTPTPTPKQSPEKTAALDNSASDCISTLVPQKRRRAIRTYGSKKRTLEVASDSRSKRQKPTRPASRSAVPAAPPPRPRSASTCERLMDEVSRQLQNEAAEAERRRCEETDKENQAHGTTATATATATATTTKTTTKTKTSCPKTPQKPPTPHKSPRKALGIMRYFQPAAAPRPRTPPPALQAACSPTASISSMSSLSSCPSPTSPLSVCSFEVVTEHGCETEAEAEAEIEAEAEDSEAVTDTLMSPMVRREQRPRQKRRLTIRPDHAVRSKEDADEEEEKGGDNESEDGPARLANTPIVKGPTSTATSTTKTKAKTVQTTLSLTIGPSDSGSVRECKACNILYNPLHEKDAKFHARYHASVVGKARKV